MFGKKKGHGFFCRCEICKTKRRQSLLYLASLMALVIIIFYQAFLTIFVTTKLNAIILFIELCCLFIGLFRILF